MRNRIQETLKLIFMNAVFFSMILFPLNYLADSKLRELRKLFIKPEHFDFYSKYHYRLHHIRETNFLKRVEEFSKPAVNDYLFTKIGDNNHQILVQGDSWIEQMLSYESSYQLLKKSASRNKVQYLLAGISSYSPTLMTVQLQVLRDDFNVNPKIIVAYIDQTDIGDEVCRYRNKIEVDPNGKLKILPNDLQVKRGYDYEYDIQRINVLDSDEIALFRFAGLAKLDIKRRFFTPKGGCGWEQISNPLYSKMTEDEKVYFVERVKKYIEEVFSNSDSVDKLILVTHFHRGHVFKNYSLDVAELVSMAVEQSGYKKRIQTMAFTGSRYPGFSDQELFIEGDRASHLKETPHSEIFTREIINSIEAAL